LRRGAGVQGRRGEQTLRNVLEAAGLSKHFDFDEQASVQTDHGRRRPDVCVYMPNNGLFVVDAKCSLNAYLDAQDAPDDNAREAALARHATSVRNHINELSGKAYWDQFEGSPDFVVMFVPGDGILAAALDRAPELMTEAMDRRVMLATPSTLFALCKAVAYGWRMQDQAQSSAQIAELGRELYKRIAVMAEHAQQLGRSLDTAVRRYNDFTGSLETRVLSQARRFEELAADHEGKRVPELAQLESRVLRLVEAPPEPAALTLREAAPTSAA
jgi:DNA recombination protein RmuC